MALGANRDYKTRDRSARRSLAVHAERMAELQATGMTREAASAAAYSEMRSGQLNDRMRNWTDPVRKTN